MMLGYGLLMVAGWAIASQLVTKSPSHILRVFIVSFLASTLAFLSFGALNPLREFGIGAFCLFGSVSIWTAKSLLFPAAKPNVRDMDGDHSIGKPPEYYE